MNTTSTLQALPFLALLALGCSAEVADPVAEDSTPLDAMTEPGTQAVAMLSSEVPWIGEHPATSFPVGAGSPPLDLPQDPNTLYIFVRHDVASCNYPWAPLGCIDGPGSCDDEWEHMITIPIADQQTGTIPLDDPILSSVGGELTILQIDGAEVSFELAGTGSEAVDGPYTAPRCIPAP